MGVRSDGCAGGTGHESAPPEGSPYPVPRGLHPPTGRRRKGGGRGGGIATSVRIGLLCGFLGLLAGWPFDTARGAQEPPLADRHQKAGLECTGCHPETPPKTRVATAVCLGCHGDYSKLAARTGTREPNPHDSHLGEVACEKCHHAHKRSENLCGTCHDMDLRVP
jgi:fumarate reductase flavoprotein subunit